MKAALGALFLCLSAAPAQAQDETVPEPPTPVDLRPSTVRFRAETPGLSVRYLTDPVLEDSSGGLVVRSVAESRYAPLCDVPCDRELPQGHVGLAVERGGHLVRFSRPLGIDGPTGVRLRWEDRTDLRIGGVLTIIFGAVIGLTAGVLTAALATDVGVGVGGLVGGGALTVTTTVLGILFALTEDGATFDAVPMPADASGLFSSEWN